MSRVLAIVGPTASGKSALAVEVARRLAEANRGAQVIGTDSMQAYSGLNIGTATPTVAEQCGVPHHLIDVWPVDHELTVAEFQADARAAIARVVAAGDLPIVVGGSGLYVSAVLDDLRFPGTDPAVRARWQAELDRTGAEALHAELVLRDPDAAAVILPTNGRRIVRALEVIEITGGPFVAQLPEPVDMFDTVRVGLDVPRDVLDERIAARVAAMFDAGFVDEVRTLVASGVPMSRTAERALGYQQVLALLAGECDEATARRETVDATRRFARRQQRWFRRDSRIHWLPYNGETLVADVAALVSAP